MAKELRHETLVDTVADGTQTASAGAEFRNDLSGMIHIRELDINAVLRTAGINEGVTVEISKAPVRQGAVANGPFFLMQLEIGMPASGATPVDGEITGTKVKRWERGQLTLEPGESLFMNITKTGTGGAATGFATIAYEF